MAQSLLLEVHSHLAAVIEPGNKPHLDSFPLPVCTLQFIFTLPFHQKHITQKELPQVQPTLAYHTARTRNPVILYILESNLHSVFGDFLNRKS